MPLILVVEQEQRYVERIEEALSPHGWEVVSVEDRTAVMRLVADRAADLVVVNAEVEDARDLVSSFSRANGGPGTVVLIPESGDNGVVREEADEVLHKPFTDQDLRLAVRRCMSAAREAPVEAAQPQGERLSSEDLFGDVVLELEGAFSLGDQSEATPEPAIEEPAIEEPVAAEPPAAEPAIEAVGAEEPAEPAAEALVVEVETEIDEALAGVGDEAPDAAEEEARAEAAEDVAEEPVEEPVEEPIEEPAVAAAVEESEEEPVADEVEREAEPAVEEPSVEDELEAEQISEAAEEAADEEEPRVVEPEIEPALEEPPVEETFEAVPVDSEGPQEDEPQEEVVAAIEEVPAEAPTPPKPDLEDRLREAVLAGKAAAAAEETDVAAGKDAGEVTDLLLEKALGTLSWAGESAPEVDAEFSEPAHATDEEVDELLSAAVGTSTKEEPAEEAAADESVDEELEVEETEFVEAEEEESPALDVIEAELRDRDEGEYRDRMKLVWAIIVIALLALAAFIVTRQLGGEARTEPPTEPPAVSAPAPAAAGVDAVGADAQQEPADAAASEETGDAENTEEENGGGS